MKKFILAIFLLVPILSGCASIVSGNQQTLYIETPEVEGAECKLKDSKAGSWYLESTPDAVTVLKGNGPMNVKCTKKGYKTTVVSVNEGVSGATFGNIILGGGIGIFVDAATGAAQKYPDKIVLWMEPKTWKSSSAKKKWFAKKEAYEAEIKRKEEEKKAAQNQRGHRNN